MPKTLIVRSILNVKVVNAVNCNNFTLKFSSITIFIVLHNFMQIVSGYYLFLLYIHNKEKNIWL